MTCIFVVFKKKQRKTKKKPNYFGRPASQQNKKNKNININRPLYGLPRLLLDLVPYKNTNGYCILCFEDVPWQFVIVVLVLKKYF